MIYLLFFLLLFDGIANAKNYCSECECCKNGIKRCIDNGFDIKCLDGCIDGYYGVDCSHACISNCLSCSNNTTCTTCRTGFYGESCKRCPRNCLTCSSPDNCQKCKDGFYNGRYVDTIGSYYSNCNFACPNNCTSCTSYRNCIKYDCKEGFYRPDCNKCTDGRFGVNCDQNCLENCFICMNGTTCIKCSPRHFGDKCELCPPNCSSCNSSNHCTACDRGYYGEVCNLKCPKHCLNNDCDKLNGTCKSCIDGFYGKDCRAKCPENCLCLHLRSESKCYLDNVTCKFGHQCACHAYCECDSKGICKQVRAGVSFQNVTEKCDACPKNCKGNICDSFNGNCTKNCKDRHSTNLCDLYNGTCLHGCNTLTRYGKHCEYNCSITCRNHTCNWKTGSCLNGCIDNFYGDHCETACSINCIRNSDEIVCNDLNGHCIAGCKVGFHGDTCEQKCNSNCLSNKCDKNTGNCSIGCHEGFTGPKCDKAQIHKVADDISTAVIFGASAGAVLFMIFLCAAIILLIRRKVLVKKARNEEIPDEVRINEMVSLVSEIDLRDTEYAKPNKPKKSVREFMLTEGKSKVKILEEIDAEDIDSECDNTYYNFIEVQKRRIILGQLADVVSRKTKEDIAEEFKELPAGLIKPYKESQKKCNTVKNRYKGIYPYDHTRVVLKDRDSDYINANFIDGYRKKNAYIASQGPTYKHMGDMSAFWRMVWQEKVGKIVMLTRLKEAEALKCDQYWPNKNYRHLYANIEVICEAEEIYADYTVRNFVVQKGSEKRQLVQLHFTAWPDKRIPDDVNSLVEFRQKIHSTQTILDGPTIVHCSAGVGRTGTYIALDILTTRGESEGRVDIYACVKNIRLQRVNMVQTAEQYRFLYDAVVHTLTFDCKPVEAINFSEYLNTYGENYMKEQFQKIQASVEDRTEDEIEAVERNKAFNLKNRQGADIPGNRHRPRLTLFRGSDTSDYINAVYVNSFKTENRYLVTQTPLPGTVDDFLTLIMQEKVSCVIDMEPDDNNKDVGTYYPAYDQTIKTDMFTVIAEPGESTDQYKIRKLTIKHQKNIYETTVKHIQFTKWDDRKKVPEEPGKFVQFIEDIELKYLGNEKEGPVLVHCLTGAVKSGMFCVVSILLEKVQIGQEVSVVNTVRQVKHRRHMSIPDSEQYIFCHQCINEYLHSFETYSNFAFKK